MKQNLHKNAGKFYNVGTKRSSNFARVHLINNMIAKLQNSIYQRKRLSGRKSEEFYILHTGLGYFILVLLPPSPLVMAILLHQTQTWL